MAVHRRSVKTLCSAVAATGMLFAGASAARAEDIPSLSPEAVAMRKAAREAGVPEVQVPLHTFAQIQSIKAAAPLWQHKLNSLVQQRLDLIDAHGLLAAGKIKDAAEYATKEVHIDALGRLRVECRVDDEKVFDSAFFEKLGGALEERAMGYGMLICWIPADRMEEFASRADVRAIMHVEPPYCNTGGVLSEGDALHNCDDVRTLFGFNGNGVTVGVISDGVVSRASAQGTGDLPNTINVSAACVGAGDEGTGMLEIVHDLAPNANLAFCGTGGGMTTFINAINNLVAIPVDIITDDLIAGGEPLFQDGPVAMAKQAAVAAGVFYTCSAGNRGGQHYQGNLNAPALVNIDGNGFRAHDFGGGDYTLNITLASSNSIRLQWAEPLGGSSTDLDLYIVDGMGNILASSVAFQTGSEDPTEAVSFNATAGTPAQIIVHRFTNAASNIFFDLRAFGSVGWNEHSVPEGSLDPVARQAEIFVAGAANASNSNNVTGYSSRGPALRYFPGPLVSRLKPDGIGIDGVNVTGAGCFACPSPCPPQGGCRFFGTSASTPHVAGVAALLLQFQPGLTPAQVSDVLRNTAIDMDAVGPDNNAGYGLVDALGAICSFDQGAPTISGSATGGAVNGNCQYTVNFSATIDDDLCLQADNVNVTASAQGGAATVGTPTVNKTQVNGQRVTLTGSVLVSNLLSCPATIEIHVTAADCCGRQATPFVTTAAVTDNIAPVITTCSATGGAVDQNCIFDIPFSATFTDNCHIDANAQQVAVTAQLLTNNATLGTPQVTRSQTSPNQVNVNGTVRVSNLTSCPVRVRITFTPTDRCGNVGQPCVREVEVVDNTPPSITCPPPITVQHGNLICDDAVLNWLNSATATDNCDTSVTIVNDAPLCGFPYGSTTTVTWTATDNCNNSSQCQSTITVLPASRAGVDQKGSLLIYPKIALRWRQQAGQWRLIEDTFVTLTNDFPAPVDVQLYFIQGDVPLAAAGGERAHPGWNKSDNIIHLTGDEPAYWSASTGLPKGVTPFGALDGGNPPGRPDPDGSADRVLRGYLLAWAVDNGDREIRWNHLSGDALVLNYADSSAWQYSPWAYITRCVDHGNQPLDCTLFDANGTCCTASVIPGRLDSDGFEYSFNPGLLLGDFYASNPPQGNPAGPSALSRRGAGGAVTAAVDADTRITFVTSSADLRQETVGPTTTKARFDIWNQNEVRFSGEEYCLSCWDSRLASRITSIPNHFLRLNLQSDKGKYRVDGVAHPPCNAVNAAIVGASELLLTFPTGKEVAGGTLIGQDLEAGRILYDVLRGTGEATQPGVGPAKPAADDALTVPWRELTPATTTSSAKR